LELNPALLGLLQPSVKMLIPSVEKAGLSTLHSEEN